MAIVCAISAAALYGISAPASKLLLREIPPALMAALLYLGAGIGMTAVNSMNRWNKAVKDEAKMTKKEMPYVSGMIILDIAAPIFFMMGLTMTNSANVALLNNFEVAATSVIALILFKESIGRQMWYAIGLITIASIILSFKDFSAFSFSSGSIFILIACICWGLENNCTRKLSMKDPVQIVIVKGFGSGIGSLIISLAIKEFSSNIAYILLALLLGFVAYGISIYLYISAQRELGAARTSAYYAASPFIGVLISWVVLREGISGSFLVALAIMLAGTAFSIAEDHRHMHTHMEETHEHRHSHDDSHHNHPHDPDAAGEHNHEHTHEAIGHRHEHLPDTHHRHVH
ncbi:DMT family transporter [Parasporobacterium paucivorans]|nr:DMT family transporter [Parasporobacterium paucivorans]